MENGNSTSTNPYNFTFNLPQHYNHLADQYTNGPYRIYSYGKNILPWLILHSINNVNLRLMNNKDLQKGLLNINVTKWDHEHAKNSYAVEHGIIDATVKFYYLTDKSSKKFHVSPFMYLDSFVIYSSVKKERDDTEVLSIQGLGGLVWVLVALSLLGVSAVSSYIDNRKNIRRESHFTSFAKSLWIHAADIVNNSVACAKKVAVPLRYTRAWWLLGVTILIQFWCAGLKSHLLVDDFLHIDSLEDLMSNPNIICYFRPTARLIKLLEDEDSKYTKLRSQLRRKREGYWDLDEEIIEKLIRGKAVVIEESTMLLQPGLFKKLKRKKRKLYVGKTKYDQFYLHMFFNKRLPRHIKERIDYV